MSKVKLQKGESLYFGSQSKTENNIFRVHTTFPSLLFSCCRWCNVKTIFSIVFWIKINTRKINIFSNIIYFKIFFRHWGVKCQRSSFIDSINWRQCILYYSKLHVNYIERALKNKILLNQSLSQIIDILIFFKCWTFYKRFHATENCTFTEIQ